MGRRNCLRISVGVQVKTDATERPECALNRFATKVTRALLARDRRYAADGRMARIDLSEISEGSSGIYVGRECKTLAAMREYRETETPLSAARKPIRTRLDVRSARKWLSSGGRVPINLPAF